MTAEEDSLLLVLPVPFRVDRSGRMLIEKQALNGINLWAENFAKVVVACPLQSNIAQNEDATIDYLPVDQLKAPDRIKLVSLPPRNGLLNFITSYKKARKLIGENIQVCHYLSFAIGGLIGDWASVAALEAIKQHRSYSIWTDRVEHQVIKFSFSDVKGLRRFYRFVRDRMIISPLMRRLEHYVISKCGLGLFHGKACYEAYASYCKQPHVVHNIHLNEEDRINKDTLAIKIHHAKSAQRLNFLYSGRVAAMKGPFDWIKVMFELKLRQLDFEAVWLGDGPLLNEARTEIDRLGLDQQVVFLGHMGERNDLLKMMREADLFVFCHKTPESPRCLIEALMSATPIIGYESSYPRDLLSDYSANLLTPSNDPLALAERIIHYDRNRVELVQAILRCDQLGSQYSGSAVFQHRSNLIKSKLNPHNECKPQK